MVGIRSRRLEVPHPLELPRVRRSVVPLMCSRSAVVLELVTDRFPGGAAVVRSLDDLTEPPARLRRIQTVRVGGGSFDMVDLPSTEERTVHIPTLPLPIRRQD